MKGGNNMKYVHPKRYKGVKPDTTNSQNISRLLVEQYCIKCDLFMGKEHDFSECNTYDKWDNGKVVRRKTCPFPHVAVPLIDPEMHIKCEIEK